MSAYLLGTAFKASLGSVYRKMVLVRLVDSGHDDGTNIFPGVDSIAAHCECSKRKVQSVLREFESVGLIRVCKYRYGGRGKATEYALDVDMLRSFIPDQRGGKNDRFEELLKGAPCAPIENPKGCTPEPKGCTPRHKRVHGVHPTPYDPLDLSKTGETITPEMALERIREEMGIAVTAVEFPKPDIDTVAMWLKRHDFDDVILPAVQMVLGRKPAGEIGSLKYFATAITEVAAVREKGERLPGEKPKPFHVETITDKQWDAICDRFARGVEHCRKHSIKFQNMPSRFQWPASLTPPHKAGCECPEAILAKHNLIEFWKRAA